MPQLEFQGLYTCLSLTQELRTALDHRLECLLQISDGFDLRLEIAALAKSLSRYERSARGGLPCQRDVEIQDCGRAETPSNAGPRQAQQFPHASHSHGAQSLQPFGIPRRAGDRQLGKSARELSGVFDAY